MKFVDISNKRFGKLLAVERIKSQNDKTMWKCLCDCGNIVYVGTSNLTCGRVKSCGCLRKELLTQRNIVHNQTHTKLYEVWKSLKQRCNNPNYKTYYNYGGRGIKVCEEWKNSFESFYNWAYSNGYNLDNQANEKDKLTLDRIDVNGNYEPSNCRWVTRKVQASNMRTTKLITINGQTKCVSDWCELYDVNRSTFLSRIKKGISPEKALTK